MDRMASPNVGDNHPEASAEWAEWAAAALAAADKVRAVVSRLPDRMPDAAVSLLPFSRSRRRIRHSLRDADRVAGAAVV